MDQKTLNQNLHVSLPSEGYPSSPRMYSTLFLLDSICFRADDPQGPLMTPRAILLVCDEKNDIRCAASATYFRLSSVHPLSFFVCS